MATHYAGTGRETQTLNVFISLLRAAGSVERLCHPIFQEFGLTNGQFGVLETLLHLGPLCQKELGLKLLSTEGNVTIIVQKLEARGLITRNRNPDDQRFVTVDLTAEGRKLIQKAFPQFLQRLTQAMEHLSGEELQILTQLSKKLGLGIQADLRT